MEEIDLRKLAEEITTKFLEKFDLNDVMDKILAELGSQFREFLEKLDLGMLVQEYLERRGS